MIQSLCFINILTNGRTWFKGGKRPWSDLLFTFHSTHSPLITNSMGFANLNTDSGLLSLDSYIKDKSYIVGFEASQADASIFEAVGSAPSAKFANAARWYKHISSKDLSSLPGDKKAASEYGPCEVAAPAAAAQDEDDLDLFGDESEDEEYEKAKAERLAAYQAKKATKPQVIAKSSIVLDIKPYGDDTDLEAMEKNVRSIEIEGLLWGASKLIPIGYGIRKLQICLVIEDDKVCMDQINEAIEEFDEYVQSVDIHSFNKV